MVNNNVVNKVVQSWKRRLPWKMSSHENCYYSIAQPSIYTVQYNLLSINCFLLFQQPRTTGIVASSINAKQRCWNNNEPFYISICISTLPTQHTTGLFYYEQHVNIVRSTTLSNHQYCYNLLTRLSNNDNNSEQGACSINNCFLLFQQPWTTVHGCFINTTLLKQ